MQRLLKKKKMKNSAIKYIGRAVCFTYWSKWIKKDRYHSEISNLLTSIYIRARISQTTLALKVLHSRKLQVDLSYDHCYMKDLICQAKDLSCQLKVLTCVSEFTEGIIHTTIIHIKILTLRTKCPKELVIRMDHSNIKKINLILNLML